MKAYVSLWSADLLSLGAAVDMVGPHVAGFHIDMMDGVCVPDLLFGPDFISALRRQTNRMIDVHLMATESDRWVDILARAGADMVTVHRQFCVDFPRTLTQIVDRGMRAGLVVELSEDLAQIEVHLGMIDRLLIMGTEIGVKGCDLHPDTLERIRKLRQLSHASERPVELIVDGGIRRHTVPSIAKAGADGVVPGSLVFGEPDPCAALRWIDAQTTETSMEF